MTDEEVLAIAAQLWRQSEGVDFTMDRLAEATGVSRATLYRRFGSREAILQRLADEKAIEIEELTRPDIPTRIVQAARIAISRYGVEGVTIEQIAQEAGVGPATIYRHFGSREKLIRTFMEASRPRELLRSFSASEESDLEADLLLLAMTMLEFVHENRDLLRITLFQSEISAELLEQMRTTQGRTASTLAKYLAGHMALGNIQQADPFDLSLSFIGMVFGMAFIGPLYYERAVSDHQAVAQLVTRIFLNGVMQGQPQHIESQKLESQKTEQHP